MGLAAPKKPHRMSTENITKFNEALSNDPSLRAKVEAIRTEVSGDLAQKMAALSAEAGTPITADEFLEGVSSQSSEALSDEALEEVSGGTWRPTAGNITMSIFTLGIGCAAVAATSAVKGGADYCQL
jgi:predicted ribosomally synthesized peptide with nif11-like leader